MTDEQLEAQGFVLWMPPQKKRRGELWVSIGDHTIKISAEAYAALGKPERVQLLVDKEGRRVVLKATQEGGLGSRSVSRAAKQLGAQTLIKAFKLSRGRRPCVIQDKHLIFSMEV